MCCEPAEGTESLKQSTGQTGQMGVRVKTDPYGPGNATPMYSPGDPV